MKLNELTQEQRNALCAFGQADQDATIANLMIAGAAAVKPEAVKVLTGLADRLYRLPMSDTEYQTLFYTVKYRKEQAMTRLMLDYQCVSGDLETARPWKPYAKRLILSAFGNENAMNTIRRLLMAEKVTVNPAIRQTVHELVSDIAVMAVFSPQKYGQYLADSRSIDAAYTMDSDEAIIKTHRALKACYGAFKALHRRYGFNAHRRSMANEINTKFMGEIHSSAVEYLTFVAVTGDSESSYEMRYEDENIWLTQKMMAALYDVSVAAISQHIKRIYEDGELMPEATIKKYLTVQSEGSRQVSRKLDHYNLQMIIAVGFKVNNQWAVQFRKWAGQIVKDYTIQGWTMDKERLKNGHMFTDEYFDRQLQYIREIRLSERKFYQKVTDLHATAFDYDKDAKTTRMFFQTVQNKMHFAVQRHTAAELIVERADAKKEHMGLTTWGNAPDGKIIKADVALPR